MDMGINIIIIKTNRLSTRNIQVGGGSIKGGLRWGMVSSLLFFLRRYVALALLDGYRFWFSDFAVGCEFAWIHGEMR